MQKPNYTLEQITDQPVWAVQVDGKQVGKVWLELEDTDFLAAPSLHVEFVDESYVGGDVESGVIKDTIRYAYGNLPYAELYSRHEVSDTQRGVVLRKLGFEPDDKPYKDDTEIEWQNVKLVL